MMTHFTQTLKQLVTDGGFDFHLCRKGIGEKARVILSFLNIHAVMQQAAEELHMAKSLIFPAHHAKGHYGAPRLFDHARNDGMQWPLIGGNTVWMTFFQRKAHAAALEQYPGFRCDQTGSKSMINRINKGTGISVLIHNRDINRAFMTWQRAIWQWMQGGLRVNHAGQFLCIILADKRIDRHINKIGICQE